MDANIYKGLDCIYTDGTEIGESAEGPQTDRVV